MCYYIMFPHIVNDFLHITAQRNFAIAQFVYWFFSFFVDPLFGTLIDRINSPCYVLLFICIGKVICGTVYSLATNVNLLMIMVCLSGALKNLQPILYHEINRLTEKKKKRKYFEHNSLGGVVGRFAAALFRLLPDNKTYPLLKGLFISSSTLPSLVNVFMYAISIPFICLYVQNEG